MGQPPARPSYEPLLSFAVLFSHAWRAARTAIARQSCFIGQIVNSSLLEALPTPPAPQRPPAVAAREIAIAAPGRLSLVKAVVVVAVVVVAGCDRILYAPGQDRS